MIGLLLAASFASAGEVYINGVRAQGMPVMTMENVTVRFDAQGNIWVDAPQYQVTVVKGGTGAPPAPASPASAYPAPPSAPSAYPPPASTPAYTPAAAPAAYAPAPSAAPPPAPASVAGLGIAAGKWWLVTEDNDSAGQDVEVVVNGVSVRHVRSGETQAILDLGPYLRSGSNTISMRAAPGSYGGGALVVYVGKGSTAGGTVRLDNPDIRYTRRAVDLGSGGEKSFALQVP